MTTKGSRAGCAGLLNLVGMGLLLNVLWAALLGMALFFGLPNWRIAQGGATATGTVVENEPFDGAEGRTYSPIVEFEADGRAVRFEGQNSSDPPVYRVGQRVEVLYDPARPEAARINNFYELWLAPLLLTAVAGGGFVVSNLWVLWRALRGNWG